MTLSTLKDLYIEQLQTLRSSDKQSLQATRELREAASASDLREALGAGVEGVQGGIDMLEGLIKGHGADPDGAFCTGMEGLVKEARADAIEANFGDEAVRDAMIILQFQRITHYGLAGYGSLLAFAKRLGLTDDIGKLQDRLDNTYDGDREMTQIATGEVNKAAAA